MLAGQIKKYSYDVVVIGSGIIRANDIDGCKRRPKAGSSNVFKGIAIRKLGASV